MGIIENSKWIWCETNENAKDIYCYIRKELTDAQNASSADIYITATGRYKLYINGEYLGTGPCPAVPEYFYYDKYTVGAESLQNGLCLAAVCNNYGEQIEIITNQGKLIPGFLCAIVLHFADGEDKIYYSDESFKAIISPSKAVDHFCMDDSRISKWGGFKQIFVARDEPVGWKKAGFDDSTWSNAVVADRAALLIKNLIPREIPFLTYNPVRPASVLQIENNLGSIIGSEALLSDSGEPALADAHVPGSFPSVLLDFGKETVGFAQVVLEGDAGANMSIWYGESLDMMRVDTIIMSGGRDVFEPFTLRAFRYMKLVFNNSVNPVKIHSVKTYEWHYTYEDRGAFSCSDEKLNQIWETSVYTVKMNSLEHFVDCPWREQAQWLADARVMGMAAYWAFGDFALMRKCIRQFINEQAKDGSIPSTGPQTPNFMHLDFCCHFVMMVQEYCYYSGDTDLLKEVMPALERLMNFFDTLLDEDGLIVDHKNRGMFIDWANVDKRGQVTSLNCFYYAALKAYENLSAICGKPLPEIAKKAQNLKNQINLLLFSEEKGLYTDCRVDGVKSPAHSQQSTIIAVLCKVAENDVQRELIERAMNGPVTEKIKGAFLLSFVADMLFEQGFNNESFELIRDYWGEMLSRGATTWWETFDRSTPSCTIPYCFAGNTPTYLADYIPVSHCHAWGSGPAYVLPKYLLGVKPVKPCFEEIILEPYTTGLDYCKGAVPTPHGIINVSWKRTNGKYEVSLQKPENISVKSIRFDADYVIV